MTENDLHMLDFVRERIERAGTAPTVQQAADKFGISKSHAFARIDRLVDFGHLGRRPGKARGLFLPGAPDLRLVTTDALRAELGRRGVTMTALERPARTSMGRDAVTCAADGCDDVVHQGHLYCRPHWYSLTPALRSRLFAAFKAKNQRAYSDAFTDAQIHIERNGL